MKISFALVIVFLAGNVDVEEIRQEQRQLQGTWKVIAAESNGEIVPQKDIEGMEIIFSGTTIHVREGTAVKERFTYKLDTEKMPRTIDFTFTEGKKKGRVDRGIYLLDRNELKICIQENGAAARPTEFASPRGSDLNLVILRRLK